MLKFGRSYSLSVQDRDHDTVLIAPPLTLELDIERKLLSAANFTRLRIYNLKQKTRDRLRRDFFDPDFNRSIEIKAGYGNNIPVVATGQVHRCWSAREGVNMVTTIESYDAGNAFVRDFVNYNTAAGATQKQQIEAVLGGLTDATIGFIGDYPGVSSRGVAHSGNPIDIANELSGGGVFIDNGKVYCLRDHEFVPGSAFEINSASGLLGTPMLEQTNLNFDMLFEPQLHIGQQCRLDSITASNYNGLYKVVSIHHKGTISEAVCGEAITTVGLYAPLFGGSI